MRTALVDHARRRDAQKRGGKLERVPLDGLEQVALSYERRAVDLLALDEALGHLTELDPELGRIVELRFFGGLENSEVAEVLGVSTRTIQRGWVTARAWLGGALGGAE